MIRRFAIAALCAAVVLVVAAGALYWFLSGDSLRRALESQATAWLGEPVRIGRATAVFVPRVAVGLRDVRVGEPVRMRLGSVDVSAPLRALLARRIEDAELVVSDSRIEMPLPFALPSGGGAAPSIRTIALRDVTLASRGREIRVSADSSLANARMTLRRLTATAGETSLEANGTITLSPRIEAAVSARASTLDVDDLLALVAAFTEPSGTLASASRPGGRVTATITAQRGRLAGVALARLEGKVVAEGGQIAIDPLSFDVFGGRHNGWLDAQLGDTLQVRVGASLSNIDVAQLAAFGNAPDAITGRLTGSGRFGARGRDMRSVLASARGVGEVVIKGGSMQGLDIVRTVIRFFGRPTTEEPAGGERFDELAGNFALANGVVRSDNLTLRAADFDVFARGTLTLDTKALDGRADLALSEALSAQAGRDLYRYTRAGTRVVLPATIGGTVARPRVGIDAAAALQRGIRNEVERRLRDLLRR